MLLTLYLLKTRSQQSLNSPSTANAETVCLQGIKTVVSVNDPGLVGKHAAEATASNEV